MRTAPAIVLITAFAALSSIGDTFAALMAELRLLPAASQQAVGRIVREAIDLAASRRRW